MRAKAELPSLHICVRVGPGQDHHRVVAGAPHAGHSAHSPTGRGGQVHTQRRGQACGVLHPAAWRCGSSSSSSSGRHVGGDPGHGRWGGSGGQWAGRGWERGGRWAGRCAGEVPTLLLRSGGGGGGGSRAAGGGWAVACWCCSGGRRRGARITGGRRTAGVGYGWSY